MTSRTPPPWLLIIALYFAGLCAAGQYAKFAVTFTALQGVYPTAGASLGWLISLISLLGMFLGVIAGGLVSRAGFRRCLIWALGSGAILSAIQSLLPPLPIMMALRVIEGASHIAIVIAAPTLIADVASDKSRPGAMTLWGSFFGVTFAATAYWGLPFIATHGLGALLQLHGAACAIMALALWALLPKLENAPAPTTRPSHAAIYRSPRLAAAGVGWLFYTLTFVAFLAVLPSQLPDAQATLFSSTAPLVGILISLTLGTWALRYYPATDVVITGFILAAILVPLIALWPQSALPAIALFLALGLTQGASFASVPQLNTTQSDRALANGAMAQMGNAGNLIGTPIMLAAIGVAGTAGMVALAFAAYIAAIAAHMTFARARRLSSAK